MSHFTVIVCLESEREHYIDAGIDEKLEKYDENIESEPYLTSCHCIGLKALIESGKEAEKSCGYTIDNVRSIYSAIPDEFKANNKDTWGALLTDYETTKSEILDKHPLKDKPDADCEECKGTGEHNTTYNPDSKWDWYKTGGRWHGDFKENDIETFDDDDNVAFVSNVLDAEYVPFAVVDSEGDWHEKGSMGWWGVVSDRKVQEDWEEEVKKILSKEPEGTIAVLVDCHI